MSDEAQGFRDRMACLADESRFRIVLSLAAAEQCVSELARSVGLSQSCTTRHLQALGRRGLVQGSRRGRQVVFALRLDAPEIRVVLRAFDPDGANGDLGGAMVHADRSAAPAISPVGPGARDDRPRARRVSRPVSSELPAATQLSPAEVPPALDLRHTEAPDLEPAIDAESTIPFQSPRRSELEDYLL